MKRLLLITLLGGFIPSLKSHNFNENIIKTDIVLNYLVQKSPIKETKFDLEKILHNLKESDKENAPKLIENGNNTKIIIYKKNSFQENLKKEDLLYLIKTPKSFKIEHFFIRESTEKLKKLGISLFLIEDSTDIAAKWYPSGKKVVINKNIIKLGSRIFAEVLNHEMIHIAQSCKAGSFESYPALIGLKVKLNKENKYLLSKDIYKGITKLEKSLEYEAYSYQSNLNMGKFLIKKFCN